MNIFPLDLFFFLLLFFKTIFFFLFTYQSQFPLALLPSPQPQSPSTTQASYGESTKMNFKGSINSIWMFTEHFNN